MTHLVGVDSGGTHTNVRIVDPDGRERTIPQLDKSLAGSRSDQELRSVLSELLTAVSGQVRSDEFCMWINAAGYAASTRTRFEALLRDATHELKSIVGIANDAVSLLLAHQHETVVIVAGTGSVAMARRPTGEVVARGGNEWVVADYGGAFWIGLDGIRAAYQAIEGGPDTGLLQSMIEHYRPLGHDEPTEDVAASVRSIARRLAALGGNTKPTIASFARQVTGQAEKGDEEAQKIVKRGVDELAAAAARVYRDLAAQTPRHAVQPRFVLSGSIAYGSPFYAQGFRASLAQFLYDVTENLEQEIELSLQLNGLAEAVTLARRLAGGEAIPELDQQHPYSRMGQTPRI